jgi:hypothetical protein
MKIQSQAPIPLSETLEVAAETCETVAARTEKRITRRDLKPGKYSPGDPDKQVAISGVARIATQ